MLVIFGVLCLFGVARVFSLQLCEQDVNCKLPECLCSRFSHLVNNKDYPQIVYFGFDDALTAAMASHYRKLFTPERKNPNNCPITMSLYIQHNYTDYGIVTEMYNKGMEIGVHSVTHKNIDTKAKLLDEGMAQRLNLHQLANVPIEEIIGWRSPNLKTAGDDQPGALQEMGFEYDISLTYARRAFGEKKALPYTLDYGNPLPCMITPCPLPGSPHKGFWEIPINSLIDYKNEYPCPYVDGCYNGPQNEDESFRYLYKNFVDYYKGGKEPMGFHMHAAWFEQRHNLRGMDRFMDYILKLPDVYIVTAKQMLDWIKTPVPISRLDTIPSWRCSSAKSPVALPPLKGEFPANEIIKPSNSLAAMHGPSTTKPPRAMTSRPFVRRTTSIPFVRRTTSIPFVRRTTSRPTHRRTTQRRPQTTHTIKVWWRQEIPRVALPPRTSAVSSDGKQDNRAHGTRNRSNRMQQTIPPPPQTNRPTTPPTTKVQHMTKAPTQLDRTQNQNRNQNRNQIQNQNRNQNPFTKGSQGTGTLSGNNINNVRAIGTNTNQCIQDANCHLPNCFCRTTTIPNNLHRSDTPQLVYFAFVGPIDGRVFTEYSRMFHTSRRNPDGCPISATLFVAKEGNYMKHLQQLANRGFDVALRGGHRGAYTDSRRMQLDLDQELRLLNRYLTNTTFHGWRSPAARPLSDAQFRLISSRSLKYDSSLILRSDPTTSKMAYPYTLDFGWKDICYTAGGCPKNRYAGLWEVPMYTLKDYKGQFACIYADGCMQNPVTEEQTFQFLLSNFNRHYFGNKAPFGVNLRHLWFSHHLYVPNKKGLDRFILHLLDMQDVYIVNMNQLVDWMRNPTPLSLLGRYQPWICPSTFFW